MKHLPPLPIETQISIGLLPIPLEIAFIIKDLLEVDQRTTLLNRYCDLHYRYSALAINTRVAVQLFIMLAVGVTIEISLE